MMRIWNGCSEQISAPRVHLFERQRYRWRAISRFLTVAAVILLDQRTNAPVRADAAETWSVQTNDSLRVDISPELACEFVAVKTPELLDESISGPDSVTPARWWRPDGTPFSGIENVASRRVSFQRNCAASSQRDFVFRIVGAPSDCSLVAHINHARDVQRPQFFPAGDVMLVCCSARLMDCSEPGFVSLTLACDSWGPVLQIGAQGERLNEISLPAELRPINDEINSIEIASTKQTSLFRYRSRSDLPLDRFELAIQAVDRGEITHDSARHWSELNDHQETFEIPPGSVSRFEIKARPYRAQIQFRNVSLNPGVQTPVQYRSCRADQFFPKEDSSDEARRIESMRLQTSRIRSELSAMTQMNCRSIAIDEMLAFIGQQHGISLVISPELRERLDARAAPAVTLNITGEDLATALQLVLHQVQGNYYLEEGQLVVSTKEDVEQRVAEPPTTLDELLFRLRDYPNVPWFELLCGRDAEQPAEINAQLFAALHDPDVMVQKTAASALRSWRDETSLPHLKRALKARDWIVRRQAAFALVAIGKSDFRTLPLLLEAWKEDEMIRDFWTELIHEYDPDVWFELQRIFDEQPIDFRRAIIASAFGEATPVRSILLLGLEDPEIDLRMVALHRTRYHFRSTEAPPEFFPVLRQMMGSKIAGERFMAAGLLLPVETNPTTTIDTLLAGWSGTTRERSSSLGWFAMRRRSATDTNWVKIATRLNQILDDREQQQRAAALEALAVMYQPPQPQKSTDEWGLPANGLQSRLRKYGKSQPRSGQTFFLDLRVTDATGPASELPGSIAGSLLMLATNGSQFVELPVSFQREDKVFGEPQAYAATCALPADLDEINRVSIQFRAKDAVPPTNVLINVPIP